MPSYFDLLLLEVWMMVKSTLIGRLLHDSKSIFEDQLNAIAKTSNKRGMEK